jgi:uncharacterized membrane protein
VELRRLIRMRTALLQIKSNKIMENIKRIEYGLFFIGMGLVVIFSMYNSIAGFLATVVFVCCGKLYIYKKYREINAEDLFWKRTSKPFLIGLLTVVLLLTLEHYDVFESILR